MLAVFPSAILNDQCTSISAQVSKTSCSSISQIDGRVWHVSCFNWVGCWQASWCCLWGKQLFSLKAITFAQDPCTLCRGVLGVCSEYKWLAPWTIPITLYQLHSMTSVLYRRSWYPLCPFVPACQLPACPGGRRGNLHGLDAIRAEGTCAVQCCAQNIEICHDNPWYLFNSPQTSSDILRHLSWSKLLGVKRDRKRLEF